MRRPRARNLVKLLTVAFPGDPAGRAITAAVMPRAVAGIQGREGYVYIGDKGSPERSFYGYAANPQPVLEAKQFTLPHGTPVVYENGPSDVSSFPSAAGGSVFLDARYRALATAMMTKGGG